MKAKSPTLRGALVLALLAVLGTALLGFLTWVRLLLLPVRPFQAMPAPLASLPSELLRSGGDERLFFPALYGLLSFTALCCCGALWLALKR